MSVEVKTSTRWHSDAYGWTNTVEVWINGVCFRTDVPSAEAARRLVETTARELGIGVAPCE